jgi:hypothetical protein
MSSYTEQLKQKIREIEDRILDDVGEKQKLQLELTRLKMSEFEEDLRDNNENVLLKG